MADREAVALAKKAHDEARASAWRTYVEAVEVARKARDEAGAAARKAYEEVQ